MATPYATVILDTVESTQDEAKRRVATTDQPVLVVAGRQTAGRGRSGSAWRQAPRALFSSLAWRPAWPPPAWPRLTLVAGLAVRDALAELTGVRPGLKWPNDLVTAGGKLGGILTEAGSGVVTIGCGLNLWWPDGPDRPRPGGVAALCEEDPGDGLGARIAESWVTRTLLAESGDPRRWGRGAYREACVTIGQRVTWEPGGSGRAVDIDPDGGLVVETATGWRVLVSGEVRSVRPAG